MTSRVVSCAWLRPRTVLLALCAFFAVVLAACSPASIGSTAASSSASAASVSGASSTTTVVDNFHNADLGNGMKPVDSLKLDYAKCFTVDYYDGGYKLFCLSDGSRYLTVPEGKSAPEGMSSDITVIQQPVGDVYLVASDTMCLFDALNALDRITVSGISRDNWYLPAAQKAMDEGSMVYGGKYNAPDYELLLGKGVCLAVVSTMIMKQAPRRQDTGM